MLPFNSVFHIKLLLSPLFLKKTNALGAAPPSASATLTVCHCEKALLPFVLVKLEELCHKSKTEQFGGFFYTAGFVELWCTNNVQTGNQWGPGQPAQRFDDIICSA